MHIISARSARYLIRNHSKWLEDNDVCLEPADEDSDGGPWHYYVECDDAVWQELLKLLD